MIRRLQQFSLEEIELNWTLQPSEFPQGCLKHYTCFKLPNLSRRDSEAMLWLSELKKDNFIKKLLRKGRGEQAMRQVE